MARASYNLLFFQPWAFSGNTRWWLDAFAPGRFKLAGRWWRSAEHFYQAYKFCTAHHHLARVANAPTARRAKEIAQPVKHGAAAGFAPLKVAIMAQAFYERFRQNPRQRRWLLQTGIANLVEDNRDDAFWGTGPHGNGNNYIGKALMSARAMLRGQAPRPSAVMLRRLTRFL